MRFLGSCGWLSYGFDILDAHGAHDFRREAGRPEICVYTSKVQNHDFTAGEKGAAGNSARQREKANNDVPFY